MNLGISEKLKESRFNSVTLPPTHNFNKKTLLSDWSHKHVAFIAGLGNFGVHQVFITEKGCCGRLGSVVTDAIINPSKKPEMEFCLYKHDKSCEKCVERCIFGALKITSFDRYKCYEICQGNGRFYSLLGKADVCGKCICGVPCSVKNPVR